MLGGVHGEVNLLVTVLLENWSSELQTSSLEQKAKQPAILESKQLNQKDYQQGHLFYYLSALTILLTGPRANWYVSCMNCELGDSEVWPYSASTEVAASEASLSTADSGAEFSSRVVQLLWMETLAGDPCHILHCPCSLFCALALGPDCHGVPRHGGMLRSASATAEAGFLDDYASPASSWPDDYCLPHAGMRPVGQCFVDGGAVDEPSDWAVTADGLPAALLPFASALPWREERVTARRPLGVHCASSTSSSAPMANQLSRRFERSLQWAWMHDRIHGLTHLFVHSTDSTVQRGAELIKRGVGAHAELLTIEKPKWQH
ncbi:hypothetical protein HPB50_027718 [Hyalomma asiaticum]|nr:hypothetical protein HPB50_027718 [Hyalomma asiaticum]